MVLRSLNEILVKYASINRKDRVIGRLWTRAKFGNKELSTLNDLHQKARFYTGAISALLNTVALGSLARIEASLEEAGLRDIKPAIEVIACRLAAMSHRDGSVLTAYSNDDRAVWKELRRELVKENIVPSDIISRNKDLITRFIRELGEQGVLDDPETHDSDPKGSAEDPGGTHIDSEPAFCSEEESNGYEDVDELQDSPSTSAMHEDIAPDDFQRSVRDESESTNHSLRAGLLHRGSSSRQASSTQSTDDWGAVLHPPEDGLHTTFSTRPRYIDTPSCSVTASEDRLSIDEDIEWKAEEPPVHQNGVDQNTEEKHGREMLSVQKILQLDVCQRMPEFVARVDASLNGDRRTTIVIPIRNGRQTTNEHGTIHHEYKAERQIEGTCIIFVGTPWGLCLLVGDQNLSVLLEHFKHSFGLLNVWLERMGSLSLAPTVAFEDAETRYHLQNMTDILREFRAMLTSQIQEFSHFCNGSDYVQFDLPIVKDPMNQFELSNFCQKYLQQMFDVANFLPNELNPANINKHLITIVTAMETLVINTYLETDTLLVCSDVYAYMPWRILKAMSKDEGSLPQS